MNFLRRIFVGRYGSDYLSLALLILSILLSLLGSFTKMSILLILSYLPLGFGIYRIFSKDIYKRAEENRLFLDFIEPYKRSFLKKKVRFKDRKTFKYFSCPQCKKETKVPRKKGRVLINCRSCGERFEGRT